jgi:lipopolysaccharide/colanic/teichoic acid biosynthesis glycosyltransferase
MTEEITYIPEPPETVQSVPEKKSKKTLWIILAIVAVLLICCCVAIAIAAFTGLLPFLDSSNWSSFLPNLSFL